jgi:hypothetical protein
VSAARARARAVLAALACSAVLSCGDGAPKNSAGSVADRFVDLYIIEIDQHRALAFTTGSARQRIEDEIKEVAQVRSTGYSAGAAKPRVFYERTKLSVDKKAGRARAVYDVKLEQSGVEARRHVLVSLHSHEGGAWRVASFVIQDGRAQSR